MTSIRRLLASPVIDVVFRSIVVISVVVSGFALHQNQEQTQRNRDLSHKNQELAQCVAAYNDANNRRSVALAQSSDEERSAERKADEAQAALFLSPVVSKPADERTPAEKAELLRLFRVYQEALSEQRKERIDADDARRDHPIPDPPSQVCG